MDLFAYLLDSFVPAVPAAEWRPRGKPVPLLVPVPPLTLKLPGGASSTYGRVTSFVAGEPVSAEAAHRAEKRRADGQSLRAEARARDQQLDY